MIHSTCTQVLMILETATSTFSFSSRLDQVAAISSASTTLASSVGIVDIDDGFTCPCAVTTRLPVNELTTEVLDPPRLGEAPCLVPIVVPRPLVATNSLRLECECA